MNLIRQRWVGWTQGTVAQAIAALFLISTPVAAQMFIDPAGVSPSAKTGAFVGGVFQSSEIEYEHGGIDGDIDRNIVGVEVAHAVDDSLDIVGELGWITETEIEDYDPDGSGFVFGGGVRGIVQKEDKHHIAAYGIFTYARENIDEGRVDIKMTTYDMHVGGTFVYHATPTANPYAGLDLVILSDGKAEVKVNGRNLVTDHDLERDDRVLFKLGVGLSLGKAIIRPEVTFLGEETLTLSVGTQF